MRAIIKEGSTIIQDHACFIWPNCKTSISECPEVDFEASWNEKLNMWKLTQEGYGDISVIGKDSVKISHVLLEDLIESLAQTFDKRGNIAILVDTNISIIQEDGLKFVKLEGFN